MVADERKRAAEVEALLRETEEERDAVRGAMRVVEGENGRLRELSAGGRASEDSTRPRTSEETPPRPESSHSSHEGNLAPKEEPAMSVNGVDVSTPTDITPDTSKPRTPDVPQTPPRVHALPAETSPWADER
jgi:hypothetical protein